jgi:hypothetical protein
MKNISSRYTIKSIPKQYCLGMLFTLNLLTNEFLFYHHYQKQRYLQHPLRS